MYGWYLALALYLLGAVSWLLICLDMRAYHDMRIPLWVAVVFWPLVAAFQVAVNAVVWVGDWLERNL